MQTMEQAVRKSSFNLQWILATLAAATFVLSVGVAELSAQAPKPATLKAEPGTKLEVKGNTVSRRAGTGLKGSWSCGCNNGSGSCSLRTDDAGATCYKGGSDTCKGNCVFESTVSGLQGTSIARPDRGAPAGKPGAPGPSGTPGTAK